MMWIDRHGNIYGGRGKPGDRAATHAEVRGWHNGLRDSAVTSFGSLPKADKALLIAAAALAGKKKTDARAEAEAAYAAALASLA